MRLTKDGPAAPTVRKEAERLVRDVRRDERGNPLYETPRDLVLHGAWLALNWVLDGGPWDGLNDWNIEECAAAFEATRLEQLLVRYAGERELMRAALIRHDEESHDYASAEDLASGIEATEGDGCPVCRLLYYEGKWVEPERVRKRFVERRRRDEKAKKARAR